MVENMLVSDYHIKIANLEEQMIDIKIANLEEQIDQLKRQYECQLTKLLPHNSNEAVLIKKNRKK